MDEASVAISGTVPPPAFDSVVRIPPNAPEEDPEDENGMPSRGQLVLARIDAWVLTHDLFADLKAGKITREKAIGDLRRMVRMAQEGDSALFDAKMVGNDSYMQAGDMGPLAYLLQTSISNLTSQTEKK